MQGGHRSLTWTMTWNGMATRLAGHPSVNGLSMGRCDLFSFQQNAGGQDRRSLRSPSIVKNHVDKPSHDKQGGARPLSASTQPLIVQSPPGFDELPFTPVGAYPPHHREPEACSFVEGCWGIDKQIAVVLTPTPHPTASTRTIWTRHMLPGRHSRARGRLLVCPRLNCAIG